VTIIPRPLVGLSCPSNTNYFDNNLQSQTFSHWISWIDWLLVLLLLRWNLRLPLWSRIFQIFQD